MFLFCVSGIILVLVIIAANYLVGLVALWRSNLFLMAAFALMDLFLAVICLLNTQHYHQMGNLTALLLFSVSSFLAVTVVLQTCHQQAIRRTSTIQTANVNCYRHVLDDWYDYNSGGDKDELIVNQLLMPYDCPSDINVDEILSVNPNGSATFCTVETTEEKYLHGNRYALWSVR